MEYVKLGRTGLDVSRICLGCMSYGISGRGNHAWALGEAEHAPSSAKLWKAASTSSTLLMSILVVPVKKSLVVH